MILNLLARFYRKLGFIGIHVTYVRRCKRDGVPTVVIVESVFPNDGWEESYLDPEHNTLTSGELHAFPAGAEDLLSRHSTRDVAIQGKMD